MNNIFKNTGLFSLLFFILLSTDITFSNFEQLSFLRLASKPTIVISLFIYFYFNSSRLIKQERLFTYVAMLLMLIGDILFFKYDNPLFFMLGMASFMIANVFFMLAFQFYVSIRLTYLIPFGIILLGYAYWLLQAMLDGLGNLFIPILIFMVVVFSMLQSAFSRWKNVPNTSYFLVFGGALLFTLSESIIGYSKFYKEVPYEDILIMLTYGLGHYFIVMGMTRKERPSLEY